MLQHDMDVVTTQSVGVTWEVYLPQVYFITHLIGDISQKLMQQILQ